MTTAIEAKPKTARQSSFLKMKTVKQFINQNGRHAGVGFMDAFERHVNRLLQSAVTTHNGGKKTLDESVAAYIGCK